MGNYTEKVKAFVDAFEEVFHRDWDYTRQMLGIRDETPDEKEAIAVAGLETIFVIAEDGTFVDPKVEDETADWGNRARLLAAYRALRVELDCP